MDDTRNSVAQLLARREALARIGMVAAGAGAGALLRPDRAVAAIPAGTAYNVHDYGALGDAVSDDTAGVQAAIEAARTAGGGIVVFPPGVYLTRGQTLYSRIHLRGSGGDTTILKLWPGANRAIIQSDGFAQLTGTGSNGGITLFSVRDLTLDGNKTQNPTGGYGIRIYGYEYELTEVIVFNCRNAGFFGEWSAAGALPYPSHQMEARLSGLRSHDNDGHGFDFNGPHDSMFLDCLAFQNAGAGFRLAGDAAGTFLVNCHGWGIAQDVSFDLAAGGVSCLHCFADFNGGVGVRISANDIRWIGGLVAGANQVGEIGVQFAPGSNGPAGCVIDAKIMNCGLAAVDFGADRGLSAVRATLWQPGVTDGGGSQIPGTGLGWIGAPAASTMVDITQGIGDTARNLVVQPAFDLRAQATPQKPAADSVRVFARTVAGKTQLCAMFPSGVIQVLASG
jgi:hypothetical protein